MSVTKNNHIFNPGDLIRLRSGGPVMTVKEYDVYSKRVLCQWFGRTRLKESYIPIESLKRVNLKFSPGDLVQLRSNGPVMTVRGHDDYSGHVICQWFDGARLKERLIHPDCLIQTKEIGV